MCGGRRGLCTKPSEPLKHLKAIGSNYRSKTGVGCAVRIAKRAAAECDSLQREVVKILFICEVVRPVLPENKCCRVRFWGHSTGHRGRGGKSSPYLLQEVQHQARCLRDRLKVSAICSDCLEVDRALTTCPSSPSPVGMRVFPIACWSVLLFSGLSVHVGWSEKWLQ